MESLKERLEHTEKELSKSHDSNRDLKSKLQTVVRDKDNSSQVIMMMRITEEVKVRI